MGNRALGDLAKTGPVVAHCVALKHSQHPGSGAIHNGDSRQQSRSQAQRQDRSSAGGQVFTFSRGQIVELRNDCAEHPETPQIFLAREGFRNTAHQKQASDIDRRSPSPNTALCFGVEQSFATKRNLA